MAGVPRTLEIFNAREQLLSADLMRAQVLASRDAQDAEAARSRSFDSDSPNPSGPGDLLQFNGTPISGIDLAPTCTGASGFGVTIGAGSGYLYNTGFGGLTADDSAYLVVRWATGIVTHANPDGANPRIDVIVATPAMANADQQSRTVLVDPTTRSITAQSVYKTANPNATLSIVSGTPAATPLVPAVPAGSLPLFYVWVPAAAGSAASFAQCRASWRRAAYPWAAVSGVVSGMGLRWDLSADPTTTSADVSLPLGLHRLVIDGEVMEFDGTLGSGVGGAVVDTANSPFAVAAPSTWTKPYYIYAVGGRHNPMPSLGSGILSPITLVESLTPPNINTGKPTANMTVKGQTVAPAGAVYIGLGMVVANATRRAACIMDDQMTYIGGQTSTGNTVFVIRTGASSDALSAPPGAAMVGFPTSAYVDMNPLLGGSATPAIFTIYPDTGAGVISPQFSSSGGLLSCVMPVGTPAATGTARGIIPWPKPGAGVLYVKGGNVGDTINVRVIGYQHRVRMFGLMSAP